MESVFKRMRRKISAIPRWIRVIAVMAAAAMALVFIPFLLLFGGMSFLLFEDSWDRSRLETEMKSYDISPPTPEEADGLRRQAAIQSTSPDDRWTLKAKWIDGNGYDWMLTCNRTGRSFPQGVTSTDCGGCFPTRLEPLWSPDGQYLALTEIVDGELELAVWHLSSGEPVRVSEPKQLGTTGDNDAFPIKANDAAQGIWGKSQRMKALRWMNDTDLAAVVFVQVSLGKFPNDIQPYQIDAGANVIFRFQGESVVVPEAKRDFYETFITDL